MKRLEEKLFIDHIDPIHLIVGDVHDSFINGRLKIKKIQSALHEIFLNHGYERIIFFNNVDNIYFIDKKSYDLFCDPKNMQFYGTLPQESSNIQKQEQPTKQKKVDIFGRGPLDELDVNYELGNSTPEVGQQLSNQATRQYDGKYHYDTVSDAESIRLIDNALKNKSIKTVLIVDIFNRETVRFEQFNTYLEKWLKLNTNNNKNKCIFILSQRESQISGGNYSYYQEYPTIQNLLLDEKEREKSVTVINKPQSDELERLVMYYHLFNNKLINWGELKAILLTMKALQMSFDDWVSYFEVDKMKDISFSSLLELAQQKSNGLKPNNFNNKKMSPQQELDDMIGMNNLKKSINKMVIDNKDKSITNKTRRHIVFRGNPGTGKTVSASIIARIFQQNGFLSSGHLVATDTSGLIGQYVGHTRAKVNALCDSALGGVLFIDEAYSISKNNDSFSQEAIDTLLKRMEDDREDLIVILAGYTDDMNDFLNTNPGLQSRIGYIIDFDDYTPEELFEIAYKFHMKPVNLKYTEEIIIGLKNIFKYLYDTRTKNFGNARLVENIMSDIHSNHKLFCYNNGTQPLDVSVDVSCLPQEYLDFANPNYSEEALKKSMESINQMIGLQGVKASIDRMVRSIQVNRIRVEMGGEELSQYAGHFLFKGNPGTGKTTVAREFGLILKSLGMLKKGHLVEVQGEDLVAGYVGQTAGKAEELINSALDGVLFIDEAYGLAGNPNDSSDFYKSAQNKLLKLMEDNNHRLVVIAAGYPNDLERLVSANPGFRRRFNQEIIFEDYSRDELVEIVKLNAKKQGYKIDDDALVDISGYLQFLKNESDSNEFGNAAVAKNVFFQLKSYLDDKILRSDKRDKDFLYTITKYESNKLEMPQIYREINNPNYLDKSLNESMERIMSMIGLNNVKELINRLVNSIKMERLRIEKNPNLKNQSIQLGHFLFIGNPGTGKTVIAREFAKVLYALGIIKKANHIVEIQGEDLVAGYTGQTTSHAEKIIKSAFGGILFIDEAYGLIGFKEGGGDFFSSAQNTLLTLMENHRDELIVIAAGYEQQLNDLLNTNPGFRDRFNNKVYFEDYTVEQLVDIINSLAKNEGYTLEEDSKIALQEYISKLKSSIPSNQFGNGRFARNVWYCLKSNLNSRLVTLNDDELDEDTLMTIKIQDIHNL